MFLMLRNKTSHKIDHTLKNFLHSTRRQRGELVQQQLQLEKMEMDAQNTCVNTNRFLVPKVSLPLIPPQTKQDTLHLQHPFTGKYILENRKKKVYRRKHIRLLSSINGTNSTLESILNNQKRYEQQIQYSSAIIN